MAGIRGASHLSAGSGDASHGCVTGFTAPREDGSVLGRLEEGSGSTSCRHAAGCVALRASSRLVHDPGNSLVVRDGTRGQEPGTGDTRDGNNKAGGNESAVSCEVPLCAWAVWPGKRSWTEKMYVTKDGDILLALGLWA